MNDSVELTLTEAEARSRHARERMMDTFGQVQAKLNPMALAQGAVERVAANVARDTVDTIRSRPRTIALAAGAALLFLARKPIGRLAWKGARNATTTVPASLKARAKRKKGSIT